VVAAAPRGLAENNAGTIESMPIEFHLGSLLNALIYAVFGVFILVLSFFLLDKLTPYDLWKEVVEKQNVAVALLAGMMTLAIAIIIASAVH
jgi:putative membrane protein